MIPNSTECQLAPRAKKVPIGTQPFRVYQSVLAPHLILKLTFLETKK